MIWQVFIEIIDENEEEDGTQYRPLRDATPNPAPGGISSI